jgi:hypothetical protein
MSQWMDIETAPKDGTVILVYAEQGMSMSDFGLEDIEFNGMHVAVWDAYGGGAWVIASYPDMGDVVTGDPTHWRPLPPPPETSCKKD